ncbi:excinuclease ABC subunit UvrB [Oligoflexaceae bacterium]|nr:excinuclease ABC subunit UvrB [Oligoflexaceae bacterium]
MSSGFKLRSDYEPAGDQPEAIKQLVEGFQNREKHQVLLGVTGSGKTFTMAHTIQKLQQPTLIMAPNKTLAAQLFQEFRELFPDNAVEFFISYYDYYQPEAYVPSSDTYIAKDSSINDDIDKMRHSATRSLFEREDVIIVSSVSCIYGLGSPSRYSELVTEVKRGQEIERNAFLRQLIEINYTRNDRMLSRGSFRVRGDVVDLLPSHQKNEAIRVEFFGDEIDRICLIDALTGKTTREIEDLSIYPNSHYVTEQKDRGVMIKEILTDLGIRLREMKALGKLIEYQRLEQRVMNDVEMLEQLGWCTGIENYSRYLTGGKAGDPPPTLLNYFPNNFLMILDESHITVPQIGGMHRGDRSRKQVLVDYGFRLPSALDNRPLDFDEFLKKSDKLLHVSATPGPFEQQVSKGRYIEQIIRPTGLIDPKIIVQKADNQIDHLLSEIRKCTATGGRVLVTTLTKKMSEEISRFYAEQNIKIKYLHSDIDSLERTEILRGLRLGDFDVLVGINLLREGLDLPEVKLVAVLDADQEGFLRSRSALIQTVGRAARNSESKVLFYANKITDSMKQCIDETERRRKIQIEYNEKHNITPTTIFKRMPASLRSLYGLEDEGDEWNSEEMAPSETILEKYKVTKAADLDKLIQKKIKQMQKYAGALDFEKAADLRDEIDQMKKCIIES